METALKDSQKLAIQKLKKLKIGALFMEPGTGKTRTAIELISTAPVKFVLWLTPCQNKDNLASELQKWHFKKNSEICGLETLSLSDNTYIRLLELLKSYKKEDVAIICDESLKIKNGIRIRSESAIELGKLADYKLILNGTPFSKNILDYWSQFEFLSPKILKMTYVEFLNNFVKYKIQLNEKYEKNMIIEGYRNLDYLTKIIDPFVFEAKLHLDVEYKDNNIDFEVIDGLSEYQIIKSALLRSFGSFSKFDILGSYQRMQQSYSCEPNKIKKIRDLVDDKTIIFCKYLRAKDLLEETFKYSKVLTYGKGSFGLNLQENNKIIYFDQTWDYAQMKQSRHRIYREGQQENVQYYHLYGDVGLENLIRNNIKNKISMLDYVKVLTQISKEEEYKNYLEKDL